MKKTSMTLINEKLKGFFDLENFDPSLSSMKNKQTIKSHQAKNKKTKTKKHPQKQAKTTKTQKPFLSFILTLGDSISLEKKKKKKLKTSEKTFDFEPFSPSKENSNF
jgi:hypothetical protein